MLQLIRNNAKWHTACGNKGTTGRGLGLGSRMEIEAIYINQNATMARSPLAGHSTAQKSLHKSANGNGK